MNFLSFRIRSHFADTEGKRLRRRVIVLLCLMGDVLGQQKLLPLIIVGYALAVSSGYRCAGYGIILANPVISGTNFCYPVFRSHGSGEKRDDLAFP